MNIHSNVALFTFLSQSGLNVRVHPTEIPFHEQKNEFPSHISFTLAEHYLGSFPPLSCILVLTMRTAHYLAVIHDTIIHIVCKSALKRDIKVYTIKKQLIPTRCLIIGDKDIHVRVYI